MIYTLLIENELCSHSNYIIYRGDTFRKVYRRIGEIRSLVPPSVGVMALTATATESTRKDILKRLSMRNVAMVRRSPHKCNIVFAAREKSDIFSLLQPLLESLRHLRTSMNRIIIYCKKYNDVSMIYRIMKRSLRSEFTEPPGAPDFFCL